MFLWPNQACSARVGHSRSRVAAYADGLRMDRKRHLARSAQEPEPPARGSPRDLAIAGEMDGPVWSVSDRGPAGPFRSSRADIGPQVVPLRRYTGPPWLAARSA